MTGFFIFLFFLYLFFQSVLSLIFYVYLWQIKEYRIDRLLCHLRTTVGKRQVLSYLNILKWKGIRRPVFTFKVVLIFFLTLILEFNLWFFLLKIFPYDFYLRILIIILLMNTLAPVLTSFSIFIFKPITYSLKKLIIFLAKRKRAQFSDILVIGITGSYGKTSTKEILTTILAEKFKVLKTPKNWNTEIGVAKTILRFLKKEHQIFVVEMAAYKKGEIKAICGMVQPKIGVITGINEQHLALFGSLENTIKAKYELIESLPKDGLAVFNGDNFYCRKMAEKTKLKKRVYLLKEVKNIRVGKKRISFDFEKQRFQLNLLGSHNVANFLAAFFVAKDIDFSSQEIAETVGKIGSFEGIMRPFLGINQALFINDTYSCNPEGFKAALSYLENQKGKKIIVTPGMIELGKASARIHRQIAEKLLSVCDLVITTKKDWVNYLETKSDKIIIEEDPEKVLELLKRELKKDDIVLLEGRLPKIITRSLKV